MVSLTMKKVAVLALLRLLRFSPMSISWYWRKNGKMNVVRMRASPASSFSSFVDVGTAEPTAAAAANREHPQSQSLTLMVAVVIAGVVTD